MLFILATAEVGTDNHSDNECEDIEPLTDNTEPDSAAITILQTIMVNPSHHVASDMTNDARSCDDIVQQRPEGLVTKTFYGIGSRRQNMSTYRPRPMLSEICHARRANLADIWTDDNIMRS